MKKHLMLLALVMLICSTAFAQGKSGDAKKSDLTAQVPVDKKVKVGHLDNGLTYYIRANKKPEGRVQFRLVTNAGSVLEDDSQQGLAHFCEHMAFNGTSYYPHNTMISELQTKGIEFGREINAYTSFDETVYYVNMPNSPDMIEMGMKILDGWSNKLLFDPQELEDERGVIHEEWRGGLGADDRMQKVTWPIMLKGSKYANRLPIGLEEVIMGFKRDDIVRFYQDWYRPDLQAVIIVGDIDVNQIEGKIKEYFSNHTMPTNPKVRGSFNIPTNVEPLIAIATDKEATGATLELIWKHAKAPQGTIGDYRQGIVRQLVNQMLNDRFNELAEKASAPFVYAGGGYGGFLGRECDAFSVYAMPKENRIEDAARLLLAEMKRCDQHGFLEAELERAKEDLLSGYAKSAKEVAKTDNNNFAGEYTRNYLQNEVIPGIVQEWKYAKEFCPEITLEECNRLVASWITDENFVFYLTAPEKEGYRVPTEKDALDIINANKTLTTEPWVDNFNAAPLYSKTLTAVTPKTVKSNDVLGYTEYTVPNGVHFVIKKTDYKADEIIISSYAFGGTSIYEDAEIMNASHADGFIDDAGISGFSSSQLEKKLKGMNLSISPSISNLEQGFSGNCSPKDLETTLQLINLYYDAPRKDKESFDKNIDAMRTQYKFAEENPQVVLLKKLYETAYNNNPRMILIPTEEQMNTLNLDRMYSMFKERFADASNQTFFFVGNISDEDIALIAKYLNALPCNGKQKGEKWIDRSPKFAEGVNHAEVRKGSDNQGMLVIMGQTEGFEDSYKNRLTIQEFSSALSITALEVIREKMGGTYSPYVTVDYQLLPEGQVTWMFFINCDPDKAEVIEKTALGIMEKYIKKGPDKATLKKVQEQMINQRQSSMQENRFWQGQIYGSYYYNENRDEMITNYEGLVKSVTAKDIKAAAKKYINLGRYTVVTLKPENK